ncbi:hemolysin A [Mycoplasmopsis californica]|uniref:TlyA family RNA methyltransferase n=1 Tax=Mycoplasmopsis equigenitalium TaxID=114883 RepID=A0ABY5J2U4_9BACT|nr:TlyA family RNA methyltransferase [Mycoplasmopsis equigenitalium]UUD37044.1 TlyA family RNA methyltransferase [Mycoplasmopsis equigenitalium]VEU69656.1 hemolysin A [Mycoplasmopsis californica]
MKIKLINYVDQIIQDFKKSQGLILSGRVFINNEKATSLNVLVREKDKVEILQKEHYVSRGAYKLLHAIETWKLDFKDKVVIDIGSSTGGFTQVSLEQGAKTVYCVDSGTNQLDYNLRQDARTIVLENTNLKILDQNLIPDAIDFIVCDVSFISLREVFKVAKLFKSKHLELILLIKPQFEALKEFVEDKGVVPVKFHNEIIEKVKNYDKDNFAFIALETSPILGKKSKNTEYLAHFIRKEKNESSRNC